MPGITASASGMTHEAGSGLRVLPLLVPGHLPGVAVSAVQGGDQAQLREAIDHEIRQRAGGRPVKLRPRNLNRGYTHQVKGTPT